MSRIIESLVKQALYPSECVKLDSSDSFISNTLVIKLPDISIQQISHNCFIVRCYENGLNFPDLFSAVVTVVLDTTYYHLFGYICRSGSRPTCAQNRQIHGFFKSLGLKASYVRSKRINLV